MLNVDYVVSGSVRRQRQAPDRDGRAGRDAHRPHRLGGDLRPRARTTRFLVLDEIGNRIVASIASEIETDRAQPRHPEAAELARRLGGASPRPLAHVPLQPGRQRAAPGISSRSAVRLDPTFARAYAGLSFTHFQNAFQGWAKRDAGDRPRLRGRRAEPDGRRSRSRRALGHGARAVAARPPRPVARRAGAGHRPQPELRPRPLHAGLRPLAGGRSAAPRSRPPTTRASSARSIRCCSACSARAPWRWCASASSRRPPTGPSRRPPARTRTPTSWRSPPIPWRWPAGATRRATIWPRSARRCRTTASTISSPRCSFRPRASNCFARVHGVSE